MKIVVCAKQVPDTTEVKLDPKTNTLIRDGVPSIINPDDKAGIEAALQLKEKCPGSTVTVVSMGPPQAKQGDQGSVCDGSGCGNTFVRPQIRRSRCAGYELYAGTGGSKRAVSSI